MSPIFIFEGTFISESDEHCSNALSPIFVTEEGIEILVNDEHPLKAPF